MEHEVTLSEASYDSGKGEVTITIIKPGFNASGKRFYPRETLARDFKVFEGLKMFADHQTAAEERAQPERSIKTWVASITNVWTDAATGTVKATARVFEPWFRTKLANLKAMGLLHEMGTSIVAAGKGVVKMVQGRKAEYIEQLVHGRSVDFVTYPGAGGMVECYESARMNLGYTQPIPAADTETRARVFANARDRFLAQGESEARAISMAATYVEGQ